MVSALLGWSQIASAAEPIRFATFNASLNRTAAGQLIADLSTTTNAQARAVAEIIQRVRPDVLLINEFDFDSAQPTAAPELFRVNYLQQSQRGAEPIDYPYTYVAPSNTGLPSGFDLDNNGTVGGPNDALGFGSYPGQFGMVLYSKYPIDSEHIRTFQGFLWTDMPGAFLPDDPTTSAPQDWYAPEELAVFRLSSKSHWDIPITVNSAVIHVLASHPTPPVFDGAEDRNGTRNHDEIRFWADYVSGTEKASYIYDDAGQLGGLKQHESFVIVGDLNADPKDGDSTANAILQLLNHPLVSSSVTPTSAGGPQQATLQGGANPAHQGDPAFDTADFADTTPGNLRADYVLPSNDLQIRSAQVFWPLNDDPLFTLVGVFPFPSSDHRLVHVDVVPELPNGVAAGDTTRTRTVLWARSNHPGRIVFEYGTDPDFEHIVDRRVDGITNTMRPVKIVVKGLRPNTVYYYRAMDAKGFTSKGMFRTLPPRGSRNGLRFGVTGDWRGELAPYPAIANVADRKLDFFVKLGDTIYADIASPALLEDAVTLREYRLKHNEVLSSRYGFASWAYVRQSTSILTMIDDHEVINDFAGGAHPSTDPRFDNTGNFINETDRYRNGLQAFFDYMPIRNTRYLLSRDERTFLKPKLYRSLRFGQDAMVAILDARSFRDEGLPPVQDLSNPAEVAQFIESSFDPNRTMLSKRQLVELLADLSLAQAAGVTWKFVMVPEPIQNLGVVNAADRFEGYAAERTTILNYIRQRKIDNVVFVSADIHGTLVNNLSYQVAPFATQIATDAWEISTGSVAFNMPFGQTVATLAAQLGLLTPQEKAFYDSLPVANDPDDLPNDKDDFIKGLVNTQLSSLGYNALGLQDSRVSAKLLEGDYVATHTFGWTEFQIDKLTREMVVTTYRIENYSEQELQASPALYAPDAYRSADHDPVLVGLCQPPTLSVSVSPHTLWPPNHKYKTVTATANASADVSSVTLVSVTSNEPDDGLGDGDTPNDIVIVDDVTVRLRAERSGAGDGRVYMLTYQAANTCGSTTTASATMTVPHNR